MMFDIPENYKLNVALPLKNFIPKDLKPETKRRLKTAIISATLIYQITGEEIPSLMNEDYRCQVIQIYDIEVLSIKEASFIANLYQGLIKPLCILRIHDAVIEVYSFAMKRLSKTEGDEIVITDSHCTNAFPIIIADSAKRLFVEILSWNKTKNKTNKINYYFELYAKSYMLKNEKAYRNTMELLDKTLWYDSNKANSVYTIFKEIAEKKNLVIKVTTNAEKIRLNKDIKEGLKKLDLYL